MTPKIKKIAPDRIVILPDPPKEETESGLFIPTQAREKHTEGTVVFVGSGFPDEPMIYAVGDRVVYGQRAGTETQLDGVDYVILRQADVLYSV